VGSGARQDVSVVERTDELVERIANGDSGALDELYERCRRPLHGYLRLLTNDDGLAEEILQDTLLAAWTGADRFSGQSSARAWLYGIARRRARDATRRRPFHLVELDEADRVAGSGPEPSEIAVTNAGIEELAGAIARLPECQREALVLTFVHGLSNQEVAEVVGAPVGTIKSRLSNAKRAMRGMLSESSEARS
jgi:RNA polymerase sigma-70 factor (ECF subfamily)